MCKYTMRWRMVRGHALGFACIYIQYITLSRCSLAVTARPESVVPCRHTGAEVGSNPLRCGMAPTYGTA